MLKTNLPKAVRQKKMTLASLAKASGVPKSTIHGWTLGQVTVNLKQLKAVANSLEISVHELAYGTIDPFHDQGIELEDIFEGDIRVVIKKITPKLKKE